jgi:hypothetical protein
LVEALFAEGGARARHVCVFRRNCGGAGGVSPQKCAAPVGGAFVMTAERPT